MRAVQEALPSPEPSPEQAASREHGLPSWLPVLCSCRDESHKRREESKLFSQALIPRSRGQVEMAPGWAPPGREGKGGSLAPSVSLDERQ